MKAAPSIWVSLLVPVAVCGVLSTAWTYLFVGSPLTAALVVASCLFGAGVTAYLVGRSEQEASALLRRPELRGSVTYRTGVYQNIVEQAVLLLDQSEAEAKAATEARTSLEAGLHVRRKQTRRLEATLDALGFPVLITDARGELLFSNGAAKRLYGAATGISSSTEGNDQPNLALIEPLNQLLEETRSRNAANDSRTAEFDIDVNGEPQAFRASTTNIYDSGGALIGVTAVVQDIKDERLAKTRHAEFVSSVSHELKTPMASIRAFIEMLMDGDVTELEEQMELYGFIDVQVDRLTRLVNNMLNLARIESGVIKIQREDCELNDVLHKALSVVEPVADEKQIRVVSELSDLYMAAHVDGDLFGQAIINLLSNAIKYTPAGGEVRLRSRMDEGEVIIEVRDTGMGIPEASLPHIFERFYRVPENNKAAAGTGLGLALVHYVITDIHGGDVRVASVVNEGTTFTVTIPLGHRDQTRKKKEPALCSVS